MDHDMPSVDTGELGKSGLVEVPEPGRHRCHESPTERGGGLVCHRASPLHKFESLLDDCK
jgi:hypothetical protein